MNSPPQTKKTSRFWWKKLFIFTAWYIGIASCLFDYARDIASAHQQATLFGTVIDRKQNHGNYYHYKYSIGGRTYDAWDNSKALISVNRPIMVYYDESEPGRSSLIDFTERSDRDIGPVPFMVIIIIATAATLWWWRVRTPITDAGDKADP